MPHRMGRMSRMNRVSRRYFVPKRQRGSAMAVSVPAQPLGDVEGRVQSELALDLPDEDLCEDLNDALDLYVLGSKPRCEEAEYLELMEDALDRIARES
jgi:hypothetical protein